jgi:hypothetical protein
MKDIKDLERCCTEEWSKIPPNGFSSLKIQFRKSLSVVIIAGEGCCSIENRAVNNSDPYLFCISY